MESCSSVAAFFRDDTFLYASHSQLVAPFQPILVVIALYLTSFGSGSDDVILLASTSMIGEKTTGQCILSLYGWIMLRLAKVGECIITVIP